MVHMMDWLIDHASLHQWQAAVLACRHQAQAQHDLLGARDIMYMIGQYLLKAILIYGVNQLLHQVDSSLTALATMSRKRHDQCSACIRESWPLYEEMYAVRLVVETIYTTF